MVSKIENALIMVNFREKKPLKIKRTKCELEMYIEFLML